MSRSGSSIAALILATLVFGVATPALADIGPRRPRENKVETIEPHRAPPMAEPAEAEPPPEAEAKAEPAPEAEAKAEPAPEAKAEAKPDDKAEAKAEDKSKSGSCSITPERDLFGLALVVLLLSGAALKRRRA